MPKRELKHPRLADPVGFSRAVEAPEGRTIYLAGQVPTAPSGEIVGRGDMALQARTVMDKLKDILEANAAQMDDIVSLTIYVTDMTLMPAVQAVRATYFSAPYAAMTGVEVRRLAHPDFMIEVAGVAVAPWPAH